jgi:hypothetical protein
MTIAIARRAAMIASVTEQPNTGKGKNTRRDGINKRPVFFRFERNAMGTNFALRRARAAFF